MCQKNLPKNGRKITVKTQILKKKKKSKRIAGDMEKWNNSLHYITFRNITMTGLILIFNFFFFLPFFTLVNRRNICKNNLLALSCPSLLHCDYKVMFISLFLVDSWSWIVFHYRWSLWQCLFVNKHLFFLLFFKSRITNPQKVTLE